MFFSIIFHEKNTLSLCSMDVICAYFHFSSSGPSPSLSSGCPPLAVSLTHHLSLTFLPQLFELSLLYSCYLLVLSTFLHSYFTPLILSSLSHFIFIHSLHLYLIFTQCNPFAKCTCKHQYMDSCMYYVVMLPFDIHVHVVYE